MEHHFPNFEDGVTFVFLAKVPRYFIQKKWNWVEGFCFFINLIVKILFEMAWAFSKFNGIVLMIHEEFVKIREDGC